MYPTSGASGLPALSTTDLVGAGLLVLGMVLGAIAAFLNLSLAGAILGALIVLTLVLTGALLLARSPRARVASERNRMMRHSGSPSSYDWVPPTSHPAAPPPPTPPPPPQDPNSFGRRMEYWVPPGVWGGEGDLSQPYDATESPSPQAGAAVLPPTAYATPAGVATLQLRVCPFCGVRGPAGDTLCRRCGRTLPSPR